ncbi:PQQ-dependent dehydrogenase, methanol/ethanol family [Sphingobium sp. TB-6]|uniref:PQQ-dependent dehydrogenase, methanol/ethanol family n=1 Tax=Sphingobium sp. TB-6 TaxID=2728850 RepID=UPI00146EEB0D|nr:PQQ-dependent dehydrogenase, methanol/ethanol family [Sphingobium sp. TB-6]NML87570.1 PQQ-dependent dehydrogenase, methanol/ethanol family [Sphingobium sp. TB-6]
MLSTRSKTVRQSLSKRVLAAMPLCAVAGMIVACTPRNEVAAGDRRLLDAAKEPQNWLVNGGGYAGRYWSELDKINLNSVKDLKPAWSFDFDTTRGQESEPLVVDGVMYVTSAWSKVFALDAATGRLIWSYDPKVPGEAGVYACCDVVNRGAAVYDGKVYVGTIDARLIALDAKTGKPVWSVQTADNAKSYTITGAPRVVRGKVIIGNGGAEFSARGFVTAYDAQTGKLVWRFYTVPGQTGKRDGAASDAVLEKLARPTWFGNKYWQYGGGGTAWNAISYDPELNRLYVGTGNGNPWDHVRRSEGRGDNLFLASILALDPDTGRYIWHYQANPGESWDYNSTQPMILTDLAFKGVTRKALLQAHKNGFFYAIDRTTGKLISADALVDGISWASRIDTATGRPVENPGARYLDGPSVVKPAAFGAHTWHPMAFDPAKGLVYLTVNHNAMIFSRQAGYKHEAGGVPNTGVDYLAPHGDRLRLPKLPNPPYELLAWDPRSQKAAWRVPVSDAAGVLGTRGGLIFLGGGVGIGYLRAVRADNGAEVWRYHLPNGVMAVPVSYAVNGEQFVAVSSGARAQLFTPTGYVPHVGRVVAFKLGGKARLPADPPLAGPFNASSVSWPAARIAEGSAIYARYCSRCHLPPAMAGNVIPDLRRSGTLQDPATWKAVVIDGILKNNGMIGWGKYLSAEQAEAIRIFVDSEAQRARASSAKPAPPSAGPLQ